ncbi:MAG: hypothetical protein PUD80_08810, partial [Firmicutes bacterium]|nr:hypothetical protein [Bacillota bacterium]
MKLKRMVASILVLLLVVCLLPISAMADTMPNHTGPDSIDIPSGNSMQDNRGSVGTNYGDVDTNSGTIENNKGDVGGNHQTITNNGTADDKSGNVGNNYGTIVNNYGSVTDNYLDITDNKIGGVVLQNNSSGKITTNNGTVGAKYSDGTVDINSGNVGTIETNNGTVILNQRYGTVGKKEENGAVVSTSGNYGTIDENEGTVLINQEGGTIDVNNGVVGELVGGNVTSDDNIGNYGTVNTNNGTITTNHKLVDTNGETGYIYANDGQVNVNKGSISHNNNTLNTNDGEVIQNDGKVNTDNGTITQNYKQVTTNNGEVEQNFGTVETNAIDGDVSNFRMEAAVAFTAAQDAQAAALEGEVQYNFGTVKDYTGCIEQNDPPIIYYGLSWGDNTQNLTLLRGDVQQGEPLNLDTYAAQASRDGYKMTGYTAWARKDGADSKITETDNYTMKMPVWLQILWEKIVQPAPSNEPEVKTVKTATIPTSLSADQVKVGALVRCGKMIFKIIEVTDDSIRVATVGWLSEADL